MKKYLGILGSLFILFQQNVYADTSYIDLKDNLSNKINPAVIKENQIEVITDNENLLQNTTKNKHPQLELNEKVLSYTMNTNNTVQSPSESIIYQENQSKINAIDPQKQGNVNSYYPGLRGPNQLVIYTPAYGLRTGTNEFGTEAIVENNMVVRLNGADSIIPKNGFVISGHGKAKTWIIKNIQVGSKVYIDYADSSLKVFLTPDSLVYAAKEKIKEVSGLIEYYRQKDILYNDRKASEYLENSREFLRRAEKKPEKTQAFIMDAMSSLDDAIKNAIPYFNNELKGVWVRPVEKNHAQIAKTIERMKDAGITDIFLETYFHGKTIYPSKYLKDNGVIWQREEFLGFDPLEIWISEAHKRNMKVHIWFESFYVGNDNPQTTPNHVLSVYPMWANKRLSNYDSETPVPSLSEHNGYFLDPANVQVQTYLLGILNEIITNYEIDGINLDYVRYPQTVDPSYPNYASTNWGYTKVARDEFKAMYGLDPIDIAYGTGDWQLWTIYRQRQISEFIKSVKKLTSNKNIKLTIVVFPDLKKASATKMQNWKVWSMNNLVDGFTPLILTGDKNTAVLLLKDIFNNTSPTTKIYPGLFVTFMGGPFEDLLIQIHKTREFRAKGAIIFDYAHLDDKYIEALKTRVYNQTYENREFDLKAPENYTPQVKYNEKKKKRFWRKDNDNN